MSNLFSQQDIKKIATFACPAEAAKREDDGPQETEEITNRSPYCRDRDRILYTKSFRRLAHKTQVHLTSERVPEHNDHTRTRLTHTLEVAQIAKTLARYLSMNEDLVEAMAFGHDVGHAPFGHSGENQLNDLLNGQVDLPPHYLAQHKLKYHTAVDKKNLLNRINLGDFRHNYQSVRQLTFLDSYQGNYKGLNLTYQCLDGILRHTKLTSRGVSGGMCRYPGTKNGVFRKILDREGFEPTVESKLVAIADEIAQVCHDLNDAVDLKIVEFPDLCSHLEKEIALAVKHVGVRGKKVEFSIAKDNNENNRKLCSLLISHFTIETARRVGDILIENLGRPIAECIEDIPECPLPTDVFLSVKKYKDDLVINNYHVNRMDNKGRYIIRQLFYAYISDPRQLPDSHLKRYMDMKRKDLEILSKAYVAKWFAKSEALIRDKGDEVLSKKAQDEIIKMVRDDTDGTSFRRAEPKRLLQLTPFLLQDGDYVRTIVDYIASMTDTFAEKEVALLYGH